MILVRAHGRRIPWLIALLIAASLFGPTITRGWAQSGPTLVILVRHAEPANDDGNDPALSQAGARRARALAAALRDAGVTAILTSPFRRTRETAQPLAQAADVTPSVVAVGNSMAGYLAALTASVLAQTGTVLVVGHSNTVPQLIAALGGPTLPNICESAFDRLFVLVLSGDKPRLLRARYGAAGPPAGTSCL